MKFLTDNYLIISFLLTIIYEVLSRKIKTKKDRSFLNFIKNTFDMFVKNNLKTK